MSPLRTKYSFIQVPHVSPLKVCAFSSCSLQACTSQLTPCVMGKAMGKANFQHQHQPWACPCCHTCKPGWVGQHPHCQLVGNPSTKICASCKSALSASATVKQFFQDPIDSWLDCETQKPSGSENQVLYWGTHHHPVAIVKNRNGIPDNVSWTPAQEVGQAVQPWSSPVTMVEWLGSLYKGDPHFEETSTWMSTPCFFVGSMTIPFHIMKAIYQGC